MVKTHLLPRLGVFVTSFVALKNKTKQNSRIYCRSIMVFSFDYTGIDSAPKVQCFGIHIWAKSSSIYMVSGTQDNPPRVNVTLAKITFHLFLCKVQPAAYKEDREPISRGVTTSLGELSHLGRKGNPGKRHNFSSFWLA